MKVFVGFDEKGILTRLVKSNDPSMVIDKELEEVTNPDLINILQVNHFKKVNGQIVVMNEEEINNLHNDLFMVKAPLDN